MSGVKAAAGKQALFETVPVPKALASLALPTILSQLINLIYNVADTYFVGRIGDPYMIAAVSLVFPVYSITVALSNMFGVGGGSLIPRLAGAKDTEQAGKVSAFTLCCAGAVSVCYGLLCLLFAEPLLGILGASDETRGYARLYMLIVVVLGAAPTVLSATMAHFLRNVGYARQASLGLCGGALLNIALDPLFMFVLLPEGYEVAGAAAATLLSNVCTTVYFIAVTRAVRKSSCLRLLPSGGMPERKNVKALFSVGLPSALAIMFYDVSLIVLNALMAKHGDHHVAALGIILKAERIPLNTGVGICHGMIPLIAYNYSSGNFARMRETIKTARLAGLAVSLAGIALYGLFAEEIFGLFINTSAGDIADTAATVAIGVRFMRIRCVVSPGAFLNFHVTYCLQAIGDGKDTFRLALLRQFIVFIAVIVVMDMLFGAEGLAGAQTMTDLIALGVSFKVFNKKFGELE